MPKNWNSHTARAQRELQAATWEREAGAPAPSWMKDPAKKTFNTISRTNNKVWKERMEQKDVRNAKKSGPVEIKQRCLTCGVIYRPENDTHTC